VLIVRGDEVRRLLASREQEVVGAVRDAYRAHADGLTAVPHSVFLRFPGDPDNRIIALPAYLDGGEPVAGMKWVSSFPGNVRAGMERASAVVVLNSTSTGHPEAVIEGSTISAWRTGASAALAAGLLHGDDAEPAAGLIGCGVIGFEVVRFLTATRPALGELEVHDLDPARAEAFRQRCRRELPSLDVRVAGTAAEVLSRQRLVAIATTALRPHLDDLGPAGSTVLHVSLRDLMPSAILACDNVVDDPDHVCRAETSLHLAERRVGHRRFIRCSIGEVLSGAASPRRDPAGPTVFSPFGLGILDLAVARLVLVRAQVEGAGLAVDDFLP
jgi:N-[(2S)-2-amino-2-carboxyethyl]-L-glutamate dehydrogenase